jgi:hypothetical protein
MQGSKGYMKDPTQVTPELRQMTGHFCHQQLFHFKEMATGFGTPKVQ